METPERNQEEEQNESQNVPSEISVPDLPEPTEIPVPEFPFDFESIVLDDPDKS